MPKKGTLRKKRKKQEFKGIQETLLSNMFNRKGSMISKVLQFLGQDNVREKILDFISFCSYCKTICFDFVDEHDTKLVQKRSPTFKISEK